MKFDLRFRLTKAEPSMRVYEADGIAVRLDFFAHILRVAVQTSDVPPVPTFSVCPNGDMPQTGRDKLSADGFEQISPEVTEDEGTVSFALDGVRFTIEKRNFRITAETDRGVLYRDRSGLAYNFTCPCANFWASCPLRDGTG